MTQPDLRTPKQVNFDMSFIKNIPFKERYKLQFRAEFFNLFNTPLFEVRGAAVDVSSSQFGKILEGGGNRQMQMALVFSF